jgi:hypothetical protein
VRTAPKKIEEQTMEMGEVMGAAPRVSATVAKVDVPCIQQPEADPKWIRSSESSEAQPTLAPSTIPEIASSMQPSTSRLGTRHRVAMIAFSATFMVLLGGGYWGWRVYSHRSASLASVASVGAQQPTSVQPLERADSEVKDSVQPQGKPSPIDPEPPTSKVQPPAAPAATTDDSSRKQASPIKLPAVAPPTVSVVPRAAGVPAAQRSGILHYQGPPVAYNGEVTFDHLPSGRLKFNFDRQVWLLTIKPNQDGTKRVILTSQAQQPQTNCDVGWEIVE